MTEPDVRDRITRAFHEQVAPDYGLNPAEIEVLAVHDGIVTVRPGAVCGSCPGMVPSLIAAFEAALRSLNLPGIEFVEVVP